MCVSFPPFTPHMAYYVRRHGILSILAETAVVMLPVFYENIQE